MRKLAQIMVIAGLLTSTGCAANVPTTGGRTPARYERVKVGDFSRGALDGWSSRGAAWGITDGARQGWAGKYHAESLAGGEQAVGVLRSAPFVITGNVLCFMANGWDGRYGGKGVNGYYLLRASDGKVLRSARPPLNDGFSPVAWPVGDLLGQEVIFEAVDGDHGDAFAWLGLADVYQAAYPPTKLRPLTLNPAGTWAILERDGAGRKVAAYLSSLGGGERGTGAIRSPAFTVQTDVVRFDLCGHDGERGGTGANFAALRDARTGDVLRQTFAPGRDAMTACQWDTRDLRGREVFFELRDGISADGFAWLGANNIDAGPALRVTFRRGPLPPGWQNEDSGNRAYVTACGVPFLGLPASESAVAAGGEAGIECGFAARRIFLLGMTNTWDHGTPGWGVPGDYSDRLFIGDRIGDIVIEYTDGSRDTVPLRLGHTAWWYADYTGSGAVEPFASDPAARATLDQALDVYPTGHAAGQAYLCAIRPRSKAIAALRIVDNPKKIGAPAITAVTVDTAAESDALGGTMGAPEPTPAQRRWLTEHVVAAEAPENAAAEKHLEALRRVLYTEAGAMPGHFSLDIPRSFRGPRVGFAGAPSAELITNIYYHSTQDMDDKVDADGTFHTSTKDAPTWGGYNGFGTWNPRYGAYYDHAWSRDLGRVLQELTELGYEADSRACAQWCDRWLSWFPEQFPRINVKGKPVPGHWVRIINHPEWTQTPGMPTGFGNLENDGHGLIMLFHYRTWLHAGRVPEYVDANWRAIREAAEYICWLFDNPDVSRAHDDVLFSDSEGGGGLASIYCDVPCWLGLIAYADMAEAAGKQDEARRWRAYAKRLGDGIARYYPTRDPKFGDIWDPGKAAVWPFGHSDLAAVLIWPDYYGLNIADMPGDWLARSRRTLRRQLAECRPDHASPSAMGYGQCFITQGALLLDEMKDATRCVERLGELTYYSRFKPYIVPEGTEVDPSGRWWHRTGDLGNGVQEGEAIKCVRIVLGIDDTQPARTLFMPRLPLGWSEARADGYPVMTVEGGRMARRSVSFGLKRERGKDRVEISADGPLAEMRVRLGPYARDTRSVRVVVNGSPSVAAAFVSGDSAWAWVEGPKGAKRLTIVAEARPSGLWAAVPRRFARI